MTARYAVYFSPARDTPLARVGTRWLGRGDTTPEEAGPPPVDGFATARLDEITDSARHYGFHATLKPPFAVAEGRTEAELDAALADFAQCHTPITGLELRVGALDGFLALLLSADSTGVRNLAAACVRDFDPFRRPPTEAELARRRAARLSALEDALLMRWGYPYVMEAFRFHMTLTARLPQDEQDRLIPVLREMFAPAAAGFAIDGISLFFQEAGDRPFRLLRRYPFGAGSARSMDTKDATDRASGPSLTSVRTSPPST